MEVAGYSGTPLVKKLSLKDGQRVWWQDVPDGVRSEIEKSGFALELLDAAEAPIDAAHISSRPARRWRVQSPAHATACQFGLHLDLVAEEGIKSGHRHQRRRDPGRDPPARPGRRLGLCR